MASTINASNSGAGGLISAGDASGVLALQSAGTTALTVDGSQNVGIGTSSPSQKLEVAGNAKLTGTNLSIVPSTATSAAYTLNTNTGGNFFLGIDSSTGASFTGTAYGRFLYSGGAYPIIFLTNDTERMRIDSSGNLLFATTVSGYSNSNGINLQTNGQIITNHASGTGNGTAYAQFIYNSSQIGSITQNGTTGVLYNLTSDYRLKNNPVTLTGAKDFVMALQPKTWDWWDGSGKGVGFIAHEFMAVAKYSGNGTKDAVETIEIKDEQGNVTGTEQRPIMQSIQPSSSEVMANLVAFIQEQQATINALTARIVALEQA